MTLVRGTSLAGYPALVRELGGDPVRLLRAAGVALDDVGRSDVFLGYPAVISAVESAAAATGTTDFGRRLAARQGIEILGPVGAAAKTAATAAEAFAVFETYLSAYSPAIRAALVPAPTARHLVFEIRIVLDRPLPHPQVTELSLGVVLRVSRVLLGSDWSPLAVHLPHAALGPPADYVHYFGCSPRFEERVAGFLVDAALLGRALAHDHVTHEALVEYLRGVVGVQEPGITGSVRDLVRQLLPTGTVTLPVVAGRLRMHPKALQRRLASEGSTFADLVDRVRREAAERYLRDTGLSLDHLARELGYSEQSVLTRSCRRWFGQSPAKVREGLRAAPGAQS